MAKTAPVKGERVRVTVVGVVDYTSDVGYFEMDGSGFDVDAPGTTVEVIVDPLPTTPGSVVRQGKKFLHLSPELWWMDDEGDSYREHDLLGSGNPVTVLFVGP